MTEASKKIQEYFEDIEKGVDKAYQIANKARAKGYDPEDKVSIPRARNMAERVIGLVSAIATQFLDPTVSGKITSRIAELEKEYGSLDWRISLIIAEEIAREKYCKFKDKKEAMEIGVRVGFAYHTMGTVSSPLEGFSELKIKKTKDGKEYFSVYFSGPIRSAGGTGASVSVIILDYIRKKFGYAPYDPTPEEIKRYSTELYDFHERITNLQYLPSVEEIEFLVKNIPVQIDGDPSEKIEVSNYKDLPRVETNRIRNGICLVIGEGIAQKAPKLWKQLSKWGHDFDLEQWDFLEEFIKLQKNIKAGKESPKKEENKESKDDAKVKPDTTFIKDLVAGRPIVTHPLAIGGFRLRYGRARTSGYSSNAIHPATMKVLDDYLAIGTQLKTERPGKGCTLSSCSSLEGPIIKLEDGTVLRLENPQDFQNYKSTLKEILFLGDILINYGDFLNRAHMLIPPGYCEEWWIQELEKATVDIFGNLDMSKLSELTEIPKEELEELIKNPMTTRISAKVAINLSQKLRIPLHPYHTYYWKLISGEDCKNFFTALKNAETKKENEQVIKIIVPLQESTKKIADNLGIPHLVINNEFMVFEKEEATMLSFLLLGYEQGQEKDDGLDFLNSYTSIQQKDKAGIFIGARMGRPEKAKMRKLTGSPHVLFPVGDQGGRLRCFQEALKIGYIKGEFPAYYCKDCNYETVFRVCEKCDRKAKQRFFCKECGVQDTEECKIHGLNFTYQRRDIDIKGIFQSVLAKTGSRTFPDLIKGVRGTSNKDHTSEHLLKGIIRAKHGVFVNKDGTVRYDMTQMPLTHFKPLEIGTSIEKLKELGYDVDIHNRPLEKDTQILEILPQDIVLPACPDSPDLGADIIFQRVANMVDDMLVTLYGLEPFYNLKSKEDIVGHLGIALAPHTSAAIVIRIIGFSKTLGFLAHPMIHAATRRDCDGDEASVSLLVDTLLNFSRKYLPAHKGATQDAPLVLTSRVIPTEIDDMIFDVDTVSRYPLEFYQACMDYKMPWDIKLEIFGDRLNKESQYQGMGFTHDTDNLNGGVLCSAYKTLPSMQEKLQGQMDIAEKVRAVKTSDVARLVIEKHFIRDIKGNLRKFSMQEFRCVACNEKFRRPPLIGKCTNCNGKIIFTISEGSVVKYLEPSLSLARKYGVPPYLIQTLDLLKRQIEDVFGKEKEIQEGLGKWFG